MAAGFVVEKNAPLDLLTLGEGIYWTPDEFGSLGSRYGLASYACPNCGNVILSLRYDRDLDSIATIRDNQFKDV
jgi:hypothetical protein